MRWSFKIGSLLGIPVRVHVTFLMLLLLIFFAGTSIVGIGGFTGVLFVILIFASVVFHEMSHSLVARYFGIEVVDITLLPIGGVARMPHPPSVPMQEIIISAAGPLASLLLALLLWFTVSVLGYDFTVESLKGHNILVQLAAVNFILAIFNLLPAFPMDGGRVLRGLLALYLKPLTATHIAVGVGQVFAILLFFWGLLAMNPFMILIALFVYMGAEAEERQQGIMVALGHSTANAAMISDVSFLSSKANIGDAAGHFAHGFQSDFPVLDDDRLVGLLTRETILDTLHKRGPQIPILEVMIRDFPTALEDTPLTEVLEKMESSGIKAVPILRGSDLKGLITLEQIGRYNMLCSGYSCEFMNAGAGTSK